MSDGGISKCSNEKDAEQTQCKIHLSLQYPNIVEFNGFRELLSLR